jgi:hypothetical protein
VAVADGGTAVGVAISGVVSIPGVIVVGTVAVKSSADGLTTGRGVCGALPGVGRGVPCALAVSRASTVKSAGTGEGVWSGCSALAVNTASTSTSAGSGVRAAESGVRNAGVGLAVVAGVGKLAGVVRELRVEAP